MNRITLFVDIAGQRTRKVKDSPRVTAVAVALPTSELNEIRALLPSNLSKWKTITEPMARNVVALLASRSVAIAAATVNCDTTAWQKALVDEDILHSEIATQSRAKAGWAKLPLVLAYQLLHRACNLALTHFLRQNQSPKIVGYDGLATIECSVICDKEFDGKEDIDVFTSFWNDENIPAKKLAALGFRIHHPEVTLSAEQDERLLLLADIAAGLVHSAHIPVPGRVPMPLSFSVANQLLMPLKLRSMLDIDAFDFETDYDQIFGIAMHIARARNMGLKLQ
jgi:hypothetical protein